MTIDGSSLVCVNCDLALQLWIRQVSSLLIYINKKVAYFGKAGLSLNFKMDFFTKVGVYHVSWSVNKRKED